MQLTAMKSALDLIYPHQCILCDTLVEQASGLCGPCWRDTPFVGGLTCDLCGTPLLGEDDGHAAHCDDCLTIARPWARGRATFLYRDRARKLVLSLKHGDRQDIVRPAAVWMARAAGPILEEDQLIVPVPLHWLRMLKRRFNQAALLAVALGVETRLQVAPRALVRARNTHSQEGKSLEARFQNLQDAIRPHPRYGLLLQGRLVLLVDDVMTTGATLAACTEACMAGGARRVSVLTLARVAKDA